MIPISHISHGAPSDVLRLSPDGTLSTVDGSPVQERLAALYAMWKARASGAPIEGPQPVNVLHRRHLAALWDESSLFNSQAP